MKFLFMIVLGIYVHLGGEPRLSQLRECYQQAGTQKKAAKKLDKLLATADTNSSAVLIAYKGANEMIQAKYGLNPMVKLSRFSKGKNLLQLAVKRDTLNVEARFLRFSIQSNIPAVLNYKEELNSDKEFLLKHTSTIDDEELKKMIVNYMVATHTLTETELKKINN